MTDPIIDGLETVWHGIDALCSPLSDEAWMLATDCPGWSIKDQVAHIAGSEAMLLRADDPFGAASSLREVRAGITTFNDHVIEKRRPWPPARLLEEFRSVTGRRLAALRAMPEEEFQRQVMSPAGRGTYREFMGIRLFDSWVHDGDIRRALGHPMLLDGPLFQHAQRIIITALPYVIARRLGAPDGSTIVFTLEEERETTLSIGIQNGKGALLALPPSDPTVVIDTDTETSVRLACGRIDPYRALNEGTVRLQGDEELGRKTLAAMNILF